MREHGAVYIPDDEYLERVKRAAKILQREGLDIRNCRQIHTMMFSKL